MNKSLKKKVFDLYKKVYKTNNEPSSFDIAKLVNVIIQCSLCCPDTEKEIGKDVLDIFKKCSVVKKRSVEVKVTELMNILNQE